MSGIYHKNKEWANVTEINKSGATATEDASTITVNGKTYGVKRSLSDLTDTAITSPSDEDVLQYDGDSSKWVNVTWASFKAKLKTYFDSIYAKISSLAAHATVPLDNTTLKIGSDGSDSAVYSTCTKSTYYPSTSYLSLLTKTAFDATQQQEVFIPQVDIAEKTDTAPYIYRPSVANGDRVSEDIVGASVGWNQLVQNGDFSIGTSNWSARNTSYSTISASNKKLTHTIIAGQNRNSYDFGFQQDNLIKNATHKHLVTFTVTTTLATSVRVEVGGSSKFTSAVLDANKKYTFSFICEPSTYSQGILLYPHSAVDRVTTTAFTLTWENIWITDLTLDFGATIADHIYSLEQATAGSGIAWLKSYGFFTKSYYPYNAGELLSVEVEGKKYVGKNLFYSATKRTAQNLSGVGITAWVDDEGIIRGSGTTTGSYGKYLFLASSDGGAWNTGESGLFIKGATSLSNVSYVVAYSTTPDGSKTYQSIGTSGYYVPANCYIQQIYLQQTSSNKAVTFEVAPQVEFGNTATTYEPYKERTYTFPSQTLRGLFTLVDGELKASGDVYDDSGVVTRKYGIVNLGSLTYTYASGDATPNFQATLTGIKTFSGWDTKPNLVCGKYALKGGWNSTFGVAGNDKCISATPNGKIGISDSAYTDPTAFKNSLNGVYLTYELATPTTEQAEPLVMPQICDKNGTEEFITTSIVPVGHESTYYNYPDYMEEGEYKDFRDRVDYAPERAKWHQVGIYANGDTITIDGYYNEIMLVPNHYSGTTLLACASPAIFPFSLFKSITLQNSTESERIDITPAGVVGVTGTYFSNVSIFVR